MQRHYSSCGAGSLNPAFTVGRALAEPLYIYGKYDKAGVERRVRDTMALVGLDESYYDRYPHELSGGQKQQIGRAHLNSSH